MLFLSRKVGESIIIEDHIVLTIQEIRGTSVKIAFDYPKTSKILRKEIYDRILQENKLAASQADKIECLLEEAESKSEAIETHPSS